MLVDLNIHAAFDRFPEITTARLVLRQPAPADSDDVYSFRSDPKVTEPYCTKPYTTPGQAGRWIRSVIESYYAQRDILWFITLKGEGKVIGDCTLWNLAHESSCGELGYELHSSCWGKGIASEAISAVIEFGFEKMELNRIEACPFSSNESSGKLLLRHGFRLEGNLRERVFFNGKYHDQLYYGLLRYEWNDMR